MRRGNLIYQNFLLLVHCLRVTIKNRKAPPPLSGACTEGIRSIYSLIEGVKEVCLSQFFCSIFLPIPLFTR